MHLYNHKKGMVTQTSMQAITGDLRELLLSYRVPFLNCLLSARDLIQIDSHVVNLKRGQKAVKIRIKIDPILLQ